MGHLDITQVSHKYSDWTPLIKSTAGDILQWSYLTNVWIILSNKAKFGVSLVYLIGDNYVIYLWQETTAHVVLLPRDTLHP